MNAIDLIPKEIWTRILDYLPVKECKNYQAVCKIWHEIIYQSLENMTIYDRGTWKKLGFTVQGETPSYLFSSLKILRDDCAKLTPKDPRISIILMPEGMTKAKFLKLIDPSKIVIDQCFNDIFRAKYDEPTKASYYLAMTNDVVEGTRSLSIKDQQDLIQEKTQGRWQMVQLNEAMIACMISSLNSQEPILKSDTLTYTCTQDTLDDYPLTIGWNTDMPSLTISNRMGDYPCYGAAARMPL